MPNGKPTEDEIRRKLYDDNLLVAEVKQFPQTYDTLLGNSYMHPTLQMRVRKKMNKLNKEGFILKATIPGKRFNRFIFYVSPKPYHIVVESTRLGSDVWTFFEFEELGKKEKKFYIHPKECWRLEDPYWKKVDKKVLFEGDILKWI